jgi:tRNA threonylcarbamoyladenosine biosynthesis protein TsaE|tara:strand:+ start:1222 stop:1704 length:483 start_codon:yes stop_codon:yes gene_type:complete
MKLSTKNHEETLALGKELAKNLKPGDIILLFGDLGAGKTTLTQGLCIGLGLNKQAYVSSPTFTLMNQYKGIHAINHIDLYRLDTISQIEALGIEENLFSEDISIIEWSEKLFLENNINNQPGLGIDKRIEVRISIDKENHREFDIRMINQANRTLPVINQ